MIVALCSINTTSVLAADGEHHELKKNIIGVFGGFTSVGGNTDATFGVAYDFHVGGFGIAPTFNLDRVGDHTAKVFGVALTKAI